VLVKNFRADGLTRLQLYAAMSGSAQRKSPTVILQL